MTFGGRDAVTVPFRAEEFGEQTHLLTKDLRHLFWLPDGGPATGATGGGQCASMRTAELPSERGRRTHVTAGRPPRLERARCRAAARHAAGVPGAAARRN